MARAAQRDRAPEHIVKSLPWRVWNGSAWEKHQGSVPHPDPSSLPTIDIEAAEQSASGPSGSHDPIPWCESQLECAICLSEFAKGDRVRELPCHHVFHLDEVDAWLISRKKFVRFLYSQHFLDVMLSIPVPDMQGRRYSTLASLPRSKGFQYYLGCRYKPATDAFLTHTHRTYTASS